MADAFPEPEIKRDFGSFFASNVQDLLACDQANYTPPNIPIELPVFNFSREGGGSSLVFGKEAKKQYFLLEESCTYLNHGAFGGALKMGLETAQKWQTHIERQPLRMFDRALFPLLSHVTRCLAKFIGCDPLDLALVSNATFGTNSVLQSLTFTPDDVILTFNITYGSVKKLVNHYCEKTGVKNRKICIEFPITTKEKILEAVEAELKPDVKLVMLDHIPSNTPFIMPVKEILHMCRKRNILVHIDGAHALGSLPLNLKDIDPDFYVSNGHKWLSTPKGVAFLYVKRSLQSRISPAVISHGQGSGFNSEFMWSGLQDYSSLLALPTVLDFWQTAGPERMRQYMHSVTRKGAQLLMTHWGTRLIAPEDMFASMSLVQLPSSAQALFKTIDYNAAEKIQNALYKDFNIEVPIKSIEGILYVRISGHIHNELADYEHLAKAVLKITENMEKM